MAKVDSEIPTSSYSIRRELDYLRRDFKDDLSEVKDLKADRSYVVPEFKSVKKEVDKMGELIKELQNREYKCSRTEVIDAMQKSISAIKKTLDSWKDFKIGTVIAIVVLISGAVVNYASLKYSVDNSVVSSSKFKKEVMTKLESFEGKLSRDKIDSNRIRQINKEDMKEALKEVIESEEDLKDKKRKK